MRLCRFVVVFTLLAACGTSPDTHYQRGRLLLKEGKLNEAMNEAEAGFRAEPSWRFRILKADILISNSDTKTASTLLAFPEPPSDRESLARLRMDQSWLQYSANNYLSAEDLLHQAAEIAKPLNLPLLDSVIENRTGLAQLEMGQIESAERTFRHGIEIAANRQDSAMEATGMVSLGYFFERTANFEEALYWYDKARALFQRLGSKDYYVTLGNVGWCQLRLGDSDKGLANLEEAEAYARKTGDKFHEQRWIGNSGTFLYDHDEFKRAAEKFQRAIEIAKPLGGNAKDSIAWWYYNLASTAIDLGDFNGAEKYNQEALRLRREMERSSDGNPRVNEDSIYYLRVNQAHIAAGRKDLAAEGLFEHVITGYHEGINPVPMLEARSGLASLLAAKGDLNQADAQFQAALTQLESQRTALASYDNRMTYLAKLIRFYDRYINFLIDRGQAERALEVAESSRARVLDDRLEAKAHTPVRATRMREMARSSHCIFLSYWLGKNRSFLWAVTPEKVTLYELPPESQIAPLVSQYRSFIEDLRDPLQSEYRGGTRLSEILLGPVKNLLASGSRVVVVPDRSLHSLNFETLPDPENPSKYFIESSTLEVTPSLNVLAESRPLVKTPDSLLLIGDPQQVVEVYPTLPFAGREIDMISKAFAAKKQTVIRGADAFPAAYRDSRPEQYSWIHFTAHAAGNQKTPLDSVLILSRHDAVYELSARDVMKVHLNASLVTLSACRSAGAKTYSGEGQVGLSWAFLKAGARSVVAGLWDVTDRSTTTLMADFYDQLSQKVPPVDALRHAKLVLLHGGTVYQKPFYWGPFQLYAGTI